jgi:hypothetical protein
MGTPREPTRPDEGIRAPARPGMTLSIPEVVAVSWLVAAVATAVLQLVHADLHEHNELPPILHWMRDGALVVPAAAIAVLGASFVLGRTRPGGRGASLPSIAAWVFLAAAIFGALSMPGNELHSFLFGAEEEAGVSPLQDFLVDGAYAFQLAVGSLFAFALVVGLPWRTRQQPTATEADGRGAGGHDRPARDPARTPGGVAA